VPRSAPALVLFARAPRPGEVKRRLTPTLTIEEALGLHLALLEDSLELVARAAREAEADPFLSFSEPFETSGSAEFASLEAAARGIPRLAQRQGDLGARLLGALTDLIGDRRPGAVIVGSDSPTLPQAILVDALGRLRAGVDVVLGPAEDGGYYLIALARPAPELFAGVAWGGADVLDATLARAKRLGLAAEQLAPTFDVDESADLARLRLLLDRGDVALPRTAALLASDPSAPS